MSSHAEAIRRIQESRTEPTKTVFEEALKIVNCLLTFSQVCHEWNISKIAQPLLDTLSASRVDVLEVGGPTKSVLIDEISKMKGSSRCVNQQTGSDLHRMVDARKAAEWAIEHRPRVTWFRIFLLLLGR